MKFKLIKISRLNLAPNYTHSERLPIGYDQVMIAAGRDLAVYVRDISIIYNDYTILYRADPIYTLTPYGDFFMNLPTGNDVKSLELRISTSRECTLDIFGRELY